jgi:ribosomal protein S14
MGSGLYSRFWGGLTIALSIVVVACGFPAFQRKFGFPASLLWTLAAVAGVWITYVVRAYLFSDRLPRRRAQENRSRGQPKGLVRIIGLGRDSFRPPIASAQVSRDESPSHASIDMTDSFAACNVLILCMRLDHDE